MQRRENSSSSQSVQGREPSPLRLVCSWEKAGARLPRSKDEIRNQLCNYEKERWGAELKRKPCCLEFVSSGFSSETVSAA